ncbi:MAG: hypothetical protein R3C56_32925 [Pirellulaceae bacterium]
MWLLDQLPLDSRVGILAGAPLGSLALDPATAKSQLKIIETRGACRSTRAHPHCARSSARQ